MRYLAILAILIAGTAHADPLDDWQRQNDRQQAQQAERRAELDRRNAQ